MTNPIIQLLSGSRQSQSNNLLARLNDVKRLIGGQAPEVIYDNLMRSNPQFAQFVEANKGKTPEQLAQEYGIDPQLLRQLFR